MSNSLEFVVLTDTHIVPHGEEIYGLDPRARLDAAVNFVNQEHADAAFCLIAGDLAHWGQEAAYKNFAEALALLSIPQVLMMGNHDRRAAFRAIFPSADNDGNGFVQQLRIFDACSLLTLDTLNEEGDTHAGLLCAKRLEFLEESLRDAPDDRPLILAQHHPARDLGLPAMDAIKLQNPHEEWAVLERVGRKPDIILHGHVHRPIFGLWNDIPFHVQRALSHQVAYDKRSANHIPGSHEAPDLTLVNVTDGQLTLHQRSFLYDGPLFNLDDSDAVEGRGLDANR